MSLAWMEVAIDHGGYGATFVIAVWNLSLCLRDAGMVAESYARGQANGVLWHAGEQVRWTSNVAGRPEPGDKLKRLRLVP